MFSTFSRSWELVKQSFNVLKSDRELLLFPLISMIGVILVTIVFSIPLFFSGLLQNVTEGDSGSSSASILGYVLLFLFYLVMYTIIIYSNVALVGAAMIRLKGGNPSISDGLKVANSKLGRILGYAAISATVGVVLSAIRNKNNLLGSILAGVINFAWSVLTFLVVPVLVVEDIGPVDAIKRSGTLLKKTWGEQIVANGGIGVVFGLIGFLLILIIGGPLLALGISSQSFVLIAFAIVAMILIGAVIGLISSALTGIFQAALYNYATTGEVNRAFDPALLQTAFKPKK
ncbi:MAG TPA: DUF6159 family protein [Chloroflexia bacterium]|nr:DUF6159 family protein [Chloroflexia bacterium]